MDRTTLSRTIARFTQSAGVLSAVLMVAGCNGIEEPKSFFDPTATGRWKSEPLVVPILNNLNIGAEEDDPAFAGARDVQPEDLIDAPVDYTISPNDTLSVQISDLVAPNTVTERSIRVTQTGKISLQLLPQPIKVEGMTEQQVERAVADAYRDAQVVNNAQVSVSVLEARGRTYTVSGAVSNEGTFAIFDKEFRLLDALAAARGILGSNGIDSIYIIRKSSVAGSTEPAGEAPKAAPTSDPLAPQSRANPLPRRSVMLAQDGAAPSGGIVVVDGKEVPLTPAPAATEPSAETAAPTAAGTSEKFQFNALKEPDDRIVIKIPYQSLRSGQLKYNVIIKPGDYIVIPPSNSGEYYMGGYVGGQGAYSIPPSKITITQAITAARGFSDVAIPARTEIIRRLPGDKQVFVRVDLDKIFAGQEPDIYLKANDRVNVGTNFIAPFLGALRNGFRISYGFGFLYDRNYAPDDNNNQ